MIIKSVDVSTSEGELMATAPYEELIIMIKRLLCSVEVNEGWYLRQYPDVANALKVGDIKSAKQHYIDHGYFETECRFRLLSMKIGMCGNTQMWQAASGRESTRHRIISSAKAIRKGECLPAPEFGRRRI